MLVTCHALTSFVTCHALISFVTCRALTSFITCRALISFVTCHALISFVTRGQLMWCDITTLCRSSVDGKLFDYRSSINLVTMNGK